MDKTLTKTQKIAKRKTVYIQLSNWKIWLRDHPDLCRDCQFQRATCGSAPTAVQDLLTTELKDYQKFIPLPRYPRVVKCAKYTRIGLVPSAPPAPSKKHP